MHAVAHLESIGWEVYGKWGPANPAYIRGREPLRKLSELMDSPLGHSRMSLSALLAAVDDLHDNMIANEKLSYYNRIPAPPLAYSLPGNGGAA